MQYRSNLMNEHVIVAPHLGHPLELSQYLGQILKDFEKMASQLRRAFSEGTQGLSPSKNTQRRPEQLGKRAALEVAHDRRRERGEERGTSLRGQQPAADHRNAANKPLQTGIHNREASDDAQRRSGGRAHGGCNEKVRASAAEAVQ